MNMNNDTIYRQETINTIKQHMNYVRSGSDEYYLAHHHIIELIKIMPPAQSTLYGYKIEHLAYIAKVMEKEGITAEDAVRTFDDMSRVIMTFLDEAQQKAEKILNALPPLEPYAERKIE